MDERRQRILEEARSWLSTPFHHRAKLKGIGVDCVNFVVETYRAIDPDWRCVVPRYGRTVREKGTVLDHVTRWLVERDQAEPGDVGVFRIADELDRDQHLAIFTTHGLIHCDGTHGVCEHGYTNEWPDRLVAVFALPSLVGGREA